MPTRLVSQTVGRHGIFDVVRHEVLDDESGEPPAPYEIVCLQLPDWVTVAPWTTNGLLVLVSQHRHGIDQIILETPGGVMDPGESPEHAAIRELREETGYTAGRLSSLGWVYPNPAIQNNRLHLMLAEGVVLGAQPEPDAHERTEVVLLTADEVRHRLEQGEIRNALSALALERALRRRTP